MYSLCRNQRVPETIKLSLVILLGLLLIACQRGSQNSGNRPANANPANANPANANPANANPAGTNTTSELRAGGKSPTPEVGNQDGNNAAVEEGKRLYSAYNCNGCHSAGGGGMGPPLMDDQWIYGGRPEQIFATIVEGRPNGMPSFRDTIPTAQVWELAAYVRSLSEAAGEQGNQARR